MTSSLLEVALKELALGIKEVPGPASNERILAYHSVTSLKASKDEVPWCAAFINWCLLRAGWKGTGSAAARSFLLWGKAAPPGEFGSIVVLWRSSPKSPSGHVGICVAKEPGRVALLGGNQGDAVSIAWFPISRVLDWRKPS